MSKPNIELLPNFWQRKAEQFFKNLDEVPAKEIASFLQDFSRSPNAKLLLKQDLEKLQRRINSIFLAPSQATNAHDFSEIFNNLAKIGFVKEDLKELEIKELGKVFNETVPQANHCELANGINAFARLGYDKNEIGLDFDAALKRTRQIVGDFNGLDILSFLHALAQLGAADSRQAKEVAEKLLWQAGRIRIAESLDCRGFATLLHSLAKMEMFAELRSLQGWANNFVTNPENLQAASAESLHSLLRAQDLCFWIGNFELFSRENLEAINQKNLELASKAAPMISNFQQSVANCLPQEFVEQEHRAISSENFTRDFDILYRFKDQISDKTKFYLIEVDGPNHFYKEEGVYKANFATRQRDKINQAIASKLAQNPNFEIHYLTLPFWELEECRDLPSYIHQRIDNARKIESQEVVSEEKSAVILPAVAEEEFEEKKSEKLSPQKQTKKNEKSRRKPEQDFPEIPLPAAITKNLTQEEEKKKLEKNIKIFELLSKIPDIHLLVSRLKTDALFDAEIILERAIAADDPRVVILGLIGNQVVTLENPQLSPQNLIEKGASKTLAAFLAAAFATDLNLESLLAFSLVLPKPNSAVVETLIAAGANVNSRLENGQSLLAFLVTQPNPNLDVIHSLISAGAEVNFQEIESEKIWQVFESAVENKPELACQLLKFSEIEISESKATSLLRHAINYTLPELADSVIERFKESKVLEGVLDSAARKCIKRTVGLDLEATIRSTKIFDSLVQNGADLRSLGSLSEREKTGLVLACFSEASVETKLKLTDKFAVERMSEKNISPLSLAVEFGENEVVRKILQKGCQDSLTEAAFSLAVRSENVEMARLLLPMERREQKIFELVRTTTPHKEMFEFLVSKLDLNKLNLKKSEWDQFFVLAALRGGSSSLELLLPKINPNQEILEGLIKDFTEAKTESCEALRFLINKAKDSGCDFAKFVEDNGLLTRLVCLGSVERLKLFKELGANFNPQSKRELPLQVAIADCRVDVFRCLLEDCKMNPNVFGDCFGSLKTTPIKLLITSAVAKNSDEDSFAKSKQMFKLLVRNGADLDSEENKESGEGFWLYSPPVFYALLLVTGSDEQRDKYSAEKIAKVIDLLFELGASQDREVRCLGNSTIRQAVEQVKEKNPELFN